MPGRYILNASPKEVSDQFSVAVEDQFPPRYNIAPTQPIAIIRMSEQRRVLEYALVRWGFIPSWMGQERGKPMAVARAETVNEKPSFKNAFKRRRCLLPANGFYEWHGVAGARHPRFVQPRNRSLIAFAGIWEVVLDATGSEVETAAILTLPKIDNLFEDVGREPMIIDCHDYDEWLCTDERKTSNLRKMIRAQQSSFWEGRNVSTEVNSPAAEGVRLIEAI